VDRKYYRFWFTSTTDNPDQRIAEDIQQFVAYVMNLSVGLLSSSVLLISFLFILWGLSGPLDISLGKWGSFSIPAYLVWAALLSAWIATWLTMKIGRPLVRLNFTRQRFEADFRFSLAHLRENAESIAVYGGEAAEFKIFKNRFRNVIENFREIMKQQRRLNWFTTGYAQLAVVIPLVVVSPRYFAKQIGLGGLMQVANAFAYVHNALSFIINAYADIANWLAVTERLSSFEERLHETRRTSPGRREIVILNQGAGVSADSLHLDLPDGNPLLQGITFTVDSGSSLLVTGSGRCRQKCAIACNRRNLAVWPRSDHAQSTSTIVRPPAPLLATWHISRCAVIPL
jgi:putative ATP-binding cassette transporter